MLLRSCTFNKIFVMINFSVNHSFAAKILFVSFLFVAMECTAQPTPQTIALRYLKTDHVLSVVDPVSLKVLTRAFRLS